MLTLAVTYISTSVADPGSESLFDPWIPGSRMGKKSQSGSEILIRYEQPGSYFRELINNF
jgi:hypothetical protein